MAEHPRYRVEDGERCIDVRLGNVEQLFDNRDPAPFRERDLDPDLVEYLHGAAEDVAPHGAFRVVFWIPSAPPDRIEPAYRAHFGYEIERIARHRRRDRRAGQVSLVFGLALLMILVTLAQVASKLPRIGSVVKEGLTISAWVILWRPVQTLVYDWWPPYRERRLMRRLGEARVIVRDGKGPDERPV